jgi:hypothetical protein
MKREAELHAPWMPAAELESIIEQVMREPALLHMMDAWILGEHLQVTNETRERLGLRTIAPCDRTPGQLEQQRRAKKRGREAMRRRKADIPTREQFLAIHNKSALKPWLAEGISRATWYRRRGHHGETATPRETGPCPINTIKARHTPVSPSSDRSTKGFQGKVCGELSCLSLGESCESFDLSFKVESHEKRIIAMHVNQCTDSKEIEKK